MGNSRKADAAANKPGLIRAYDGYLSGLAFTDKISRTKTINAVCSPFLAAIVVNFFVFKLGGWPGPVANGIEAAIGLCLLGLMFYSGVRFFALGARWDAQQKAKAAKTDGAEAASSED